jgi:DNA-binding CsgD family transcriptional regulator
MSDTLPTLTDREMQVARLLPYGLDDNQIGTRLSITRDTVKTHLRRINRKWGTSGRMQIVVTAYEHGVLQLKTTELDELRATVRELAELLGIAHSADGLTRAALVTELRERLGAPAPDAGNGWVGGFCPEGGDHRG